MLMGKEEKRYETRRKGTMGRKGKGMLIGKRVKRTMMGRRGQEGEKRGKGASMGQEENRH